MACTKSLWWRMYWSIMRTERPAVCKINWRCCQADFTGHPNTFGTLSEEWWVSIEKNREGEWVRCYGKIWLLKGHSGFDEENGLRWKVRGVTYRLKGCYEAEQSFWIKGIFSQRKSARHGDLWKEASKGDL